MNGVAEIYRCTAPTCGFVYESPRRLKAAPLHPCPTPTSHTRKPATDKEIPE